MRNAISILTICLIAAAIPRTLPAQQAKSVTILEPAILPLSQMFKLSDKVAVIKVLAGDSESYGITVYKGQVLEDFKGTSTGQVIYFGPFDGMRIGWEYVLFLKNATSEIVPKSSSNSGFGTVQYSEIFNQGYSSMETSYQCIFAGKDIAQHCDYGIRVCTDYVILPKSVRTSPPMTESTDFGCRLVRKKEFLSLLKTFR